jgi:hypothetical protein
MSIRNPFFSDRFTLEGYRTVTALWQGKRGLL